jgi:hypothetical protein
MIISFTFLFSLDVKWSIFLDVDILVAMTKLGSFIEDYGIGFHQNNGSSPVLSNYQPVQPLKGYKNRIPCSFPSIPLSKMFTAKSYQAPFKRTPIMMNEFQGTFLPQSAPGPIAFCPPEELWLPYSSSPCRAERFFCTYMRYSLGLG